MTKADVQVAVLDRMQLVYLPPRDFSEDMQRANLAEYAAALEGFDRSDLDEAWAAVRNDHRTRAWPVPGAFVDAAQRARMARQHATGADRKTTHTATHSELRQAWIQARDTDKATEAARRGVAWAFKCSILQGTKPVDIDLGRLVREKERAKVTQHRISSGLSLHSLSDGRNIGVMHDPIVALTMWRKLLFQEAETVAEIGYRGPVEEMGDLQADLGGIR